MEKKKSLILKGTRKIIYTIRINNDIIWEGENVHEVYPSLKETFKNRDLTIHWEVKQSTTNPK